MLRQLSAIALFVFSAFLTFGASARSNAQNTVSNSWAGYTSTPSLMCNISAAPQTGGGFAGSFSMSGSNWAAVGAAIDLHNSKDANGNMYSTVTAAVYYYPIINGQLGTPIPSKVIYVAKQMADGSMSEGALITNYFTGSYIFATGMNRDGSLLMFPLMRGSVFITL